MKEVSQIYVELTSMTHVKGNGRRHKKFQVDRLRFLMRRRTMNFTQDEAFEQKGERRGIEIPLRNNLKVETDELLIERRLVLLKHQIIAVGFPT